MHTQASRSASLGGGKHGSRKHDALDGGSERARLDVIEQV